MVSPPKRPAKAKSRRRPLLQATPQEEQSQDLQGGHDHSAERQPADEDVPKGKRDQQQRAEQAHEPRLEELQSKGVGQGHGQKAKGNTHQPRRRVPGSQQPEGQGLRIDQAGLDAGIDLKIDGAVAPEHFGGHQAIVGLVVGKTPGNSIQAPEPEKGGQQENGDHARQGQPGTDAAGKSPRQSAPTRRR